MTKREKRELERKKLAAMKFGEKVEYILSYYKVHIGVMLFGILAVIGIIQWVDTWKDENYIYVTVVDAQTEGENFMEDFRATLEDTDQHHKYVLDTGIFHTMNLSGEMELDYNEKSKLATLVSAGTVDVLICPQSIYELYTGEGDVLYRISNLMGEEFVSEYADICGEDAILVEDSKVLEKYGLNIDEPAYLIVFQYTKHPDVVKEFIRFVVK